MKFFLYLAGFQGMFPQQGDRGSQFVSFLFPLLFILAIIYVLSRALKRVEKIDKRIDKRADIETEETSEKKWIEINLLPGEKVITDIQQGLLSRDFNIMADNNIILTNRRLIIRLKKFMSSLRTYYVELDKITVMNIDTQLNWARAIVSYLAFSLVLYLGGLVFERPLRQADLFQFFPFAMVALPIIIALGNLYLSKKVGINIAIPGFSEVDMRSRRGGGLFFQLRGGLGIDPGKLQGFIDQSLSAKATPRGEIKRTGAKRYPGIAVKISSCHECKE